MRPRRTRARAAPIPVPSIVTSARRPVVSVVSVVYQDPEGLARTLASLERAETRYEVVVVEGEPFDSGAAPHLVERFRGAAEIVVVSGRDHGPYDAMNRGILAATGDWLWFVNAGDEVAPTLDFDGLAAQLDSSPNAWAVAPVTLVDGDRETINAAIGADEILRGEGSQCHQGVFVRRAALLAMGCYDTSYRIAADYHLMCRLARSWSPLVFSHPVAVFHRGGLSTHNRRRLYAEYFLVRCSIRSQSVRWLAVDGVRTLWRILRNS